ncbi:hypothetical protein CD351_04755 [Erythrobacter sp. KY5]|uniref:DUF1214 domain-containing protein n=1 Tax=Erythrobacter sp. KY5 TaxID=2011159 RepID=UPI000DBF2E0B|nr:DUF1214 domain-containing protein [Erythrobacter sp. KY5]AWW73731.1 hypothetical protein CD351_04755 [Erythrobacter sp. KY5]
MSIVALAGLLVGAGVSIWQTGRPGVLNGIGGKDGEAWTTDPDIGSDNANMLLRAHTARRGLFALNRSEAIYYTRSTDDTGRPLSARCYYRIDGGELPAKWWSITIYAADAFLPRNDTGAYSINKSSLEQNDAAWSALLSNKKVGETGNWISTDQAGEFDLVLRLYEPDEDLLASVVAADFPRIRRLSC